MAVEFDGGVVLGADSRTSTGKKSEEQPMIHHHSHHDPFLLYAGQA